MQDFKTFCDVLASVPGLAHITVRLGRLVSVVTAVRLNVMGPRGRPTVKCQDVPDFETFRDLLDERTAQLRAGGGDLLILGGSSCIATFYDAGSTPKEWPPVGIPEKQSEILPTRPTRGHGLFGIPEKQLESAPLPASERAATGSPPSSPAKVQDVKTFCDVLASVPSLAHITVRLGRLPMDETGNALRGKNDPTDDPANIDPTKSGASLTLCDQVELVLTKPMATVNTYSSCSTPDLATSRLKVTTQFVGALVLIMLMSTFALGMIVVVRIHL
eukprot:SAG31_NODE_5818_length_2310_cov_2.984622_1_plen_274_part_00